MKPNGYLIHRAPDCPTATDHSPGVFAAGDVPTRTYRQPSRPAGMGCMAALGSPRFSFRTGSTAETVAAE